jgi:hypothetical protein
LLLAPRHDGESALSSCFNSRTTHTKSAIKRPLLIQRV